MRYLMSSLYYWGPYFILFLLQQKDWKIFLIISILLQAVLDYVYVDHIKLDTPQQTRYDMPKKDETLLDFYILHTFYLEWKL